MKHSWIELNSEKRIICTICTQAAKGGLPIPTGLNSQNSRKTYVTHGFSGWSNAYKALPAHEVSEFHRKSHELVVASRGTNVVERISTAKQQEMLENRTALHKIFSTVKMLGVQGLPLRGHIDERSNLNQFLKTRSEDVPELRNWLGRSGHKWLSHDVQNEILEMMASTVLEKNLEIIRAAPFFSLMLDETSDISRMEQISMSIRIVSNDLSICEIFFGFYDTSNTKSETLFSIVQNVFKSCKLEFKNLRGQCYDGASNVSGKLTGLQARIREEEPRALHIHCNAHKLNLAVQDAMEGVNTARNFIGIIKELINFVRDSPKRLCQYRNFQKAVAIGDEDDCPALQAFCPTR